MYSIEFEFYGSSQYIIYTVRPAHEVTSIERSPVLKGHILLVMSLKFWYELSLFQEVTRLKEPRFPYPKFDLLIQVWLCIYIRKWHIQQGNYVRFPLFINSLNTFFTNNYIHRSKYVHTKIFPYIFHIKPLIFNTFSWSHSLSDFHEIFSIKPKNKYSFFL